MSKQLLSASTAVHPELLIQSRDHIPLIDACCTGSPKNVQALYGQVRHSESLLRQMISIAAAARYASVDVASLLLEQNTSLKSSDALALTARHGKLDMVKFLLKRGTFVDENCVTS